MTNEHIGICIYEKGRFELRETDNAIIDLKGDFPPILIASNTVDDGSEPNCADTRSVLHLLNELADNNPNEERHWYLKKMLDKSWKQYHEQKDENERLKKELEQDDLKNIKKANIKLFKENGQLKKENDEFKKKIGNLEHTRDFCADVCADCERLEKENEQLKKENYELHKRLGDFKSFERYMKERTSKTSVNDIIGLVKTDEPTNSVELKKELYK